MPVHEFVEIAAEPPALFALSQDYARRLDWDPFLKEACLLEGAKEAGLNVRAWCVSRQGVGMETRYISFKPPRVCAVEMTRGPWFIRSFSASWRFEAIEPGRTRVSFLINVVARPRFCSLFLTRLIAHETRRRLTALKQTAEQTSTF